MNGANTLSCALRSVPLDIQPLSSLCDEECQWLAGIQSGDSKTHAFQFFQIAAFEVCLQPRHILNIEFLPNSRHACQIAARVSPDVAASLRDRRGRGPVRTLSLSLCQHLNANFPARALSLSLLPMSVADSKLHRASHSPGNVSNVERTIVVVGVHDQGLQCDSTLIEEKLAKIPWVTNWPFNITAFLLRPHFVCATGREDRPTVHECFMESFYK